MDNDLYADTASVEAGYFAHAEALGVTSDCADRTLRQAVFDAGREGHGDPYDLARTRLEMKVRADG
ncbi:hypothetical protein AB0G02_18310 [Actinosynnema sp. NPDC023658]|uniref:hypothetical protein n=1 Tax=Actinosynnema sp. NPDC023658 TaxID=3155465 RepID=UPI0033F14F82